MIQIPKVFTFRLEYLSTYRSELMGWSIIWIMMLHFQFHIIKPLGFISQYGFSGVEIFLFVSGLGIYYSLDNDAALLSFYKKRFLRLFPVYYFIGIFASFFVLHDDLFHYLYRFSTIGFWTQDKCFFEWYVPSLVMLYIAAPLMKKMVDSRYRLALAIIAVSILVGSYFLAEYQSIDREHFFFVYRIPAFIFGMYCARQLKHNMTSSGIAMFLFLALAGMVIFPIFFPRHHVIYEFKYYSLFFLLPVFLYLFCLLTKMLGKVVCPLKSIGQASLEIYLVQAILFSLTTTGILQFPTAWHDLITIAAIVLCVLAGLLIHSITNHLKHYAAKR